MYCGKPGVFFRCGDLSCLINDCFNVVLYGEFSVLRAGAFEPLGFVVPVHYLSFIRSVDRSFGLATDPRRIFQFDDPRALTLLCAFISTQKASAKCTALGGLLPEARKHAPASKIIRIPKRARQE